MAQLTASRTLVKSSPELWAECSDAASLARHLGAFGEIHITKLEPETAVAWEGEDVCGTVTLEPSGWGTRVVLTAEVPTPAVGVGEPAGDEMAAPGSEPTVEPATEPAQRAPATATATATAEPDLADAEPGPVAATEPDLPDVDPGPVAAADPARPSLLRRLFGGWRRSAEPLADPVAEPVAEAEPAPELAPEPAAVPEPAEVHRVRIRPTMRSAQPAAEGAEPAEPDSPSAQALVGALDSLGRAHRRPFSHG